MRKLKQILQMWEIWNYLAGQTEYVEGEIKVMQCQLCFAGCYLTCWMFPALFNLNLKLWWGLEHKWSWWTQSWELMNRLLECKCQLMLFLMSTFFARLLIEYRLSCNCSVRIIMLFINNGYLGNFSLYTVDTDRPLSFWQLVVQCLV